MARNAARWALIVGLFVYADASASASVSAPAGVAAATMAATDTAIANLERRNDTTKTPLAAPTLAALTSNTV